MSLAHVRKYVRYLFVYLKDIVQSQELIQVRQLSLFAGDSSQPGQTPKTGKAQQATGTHSMSFDCRSFIYLKIIDCIQFEYPLRTL
jgi:hypothetical protein